MSGKITVKEMKHDGLVDAVASTASFFERHRLPLIILAVAAVGAAVVFGVSSYRVSNRMTAAAQSLSEAKNREDLEAVYRNYPETPSASLALIQAGAFAFSAGDYTAARDAYLLFREKYPEHTLADFAQMGIAASLEAEERWNEAIEAYRRVIAQYPDSARVPEAAFNQGRCWKNAGRLEEARRSFQELFERFPQSPYAFLARDEVAALGYSQ